MRRTVLLLSAVTFALTACSTPTTDGTPTPTSGGVSQSASEQTPGPEVPKVANPIDLARIKQTPCNALTDAQAKELIGPKVETKERLEGLAGNSCLWTPPVALSPSVNVLFGQSPDGGTASVYRAKGGTYELVEPLEPIDGYPLTAYGTKDERPSGRCSVALGASDTETIGIVLKQSEANIGKKDPCAAAREAAIRVLTTVRRGN